MKSNQMLTLLFWHRKSKAEKMDTRQSYAGLALTPGMKSLLQELKSTSISEM